MTLWLIGAGTMAIEYARVLKALGQTFSVIGRGDSSAHFFEKQTGHAVKRYGLTNALVNLKAPDMAIVAVGIEQLSRTTISLIEAGTKRILVEKPGGLDISEIYSLYRVAANSNAHVLIGYNRRFYGSVSQARKYIEEDGGVLSANFEFTEWSHLIEPSLVATEIKKRWVLGNSSHVTDLVFHLIGMPTDWKAWHAGSTPWHAASARFAGAGVTEKGVMFSYLSDWQAPGRWGVELLTRKRRLIFRPMEELQVIHLGRVSVEAVDTLNTLDKEFKPGLFQQTSAFLTSDDALFCTLLEQVRNVKVYSLMAGYPVD